MLGEQGHVVVIADQLRGEYGSVLNPGFLVTILKGVVSVNQLANADNFKLMVV